MSFWTVLGVEPTTDIKTIRRAYAKQSKLCHPEENPEEFKRLHSAYQQALSAAESGGEQAVLPDVETEWETVPSGLNEPQENEETAIVSETPPALDFDALFAESAEERMQSALENGALKGLSERLRDPKKRNNKAVWKEFFFSEEYLAFHIKPNSFTLLAEYLRQQEDVPVEELPRVFCVWLSVIAGVRYYEESGNAGKLKTLSPITGLLALQTYAQYNQSEMKKKDYDSDRVCFGLFSGFLDKYATLCETKDTDKWRNVLVYALGEVNDYHTGIAGADYYKILAFIMNHMQLPDVVRLMLYRHYDMDNYERSSKKNDLRPLYEAFIQGGKEAFLQTVKDQNTLNQSATELLGRIHGILQTHHVFAEGQSESDKSSALAEMNALTKNPLYRDTWLAPHFMKRFSDNYCMGTRRQSGGFRQLLRVIQEMYEQNKAKSGVAGLLDSIARTLEQNESRENTIEKEAPLTFFGFPEEVSEHFTVLKELDRIITQRTEGFSYQDNVLLALFAMARTCVITQILSPISEKFERYYLRHIREMPHYLLKWMKGEPVNKEDCSWWIIKSCVNSMAREVFFDGEDVKAVTNTPEIIFANYQSFLETWFHFARFEYKPDNADAEAGMTGGFVLYPASMLIRTGYEADTLTTLLNSEWRRIQDDISLLSETKTYAGLSERLDMYLTIDIFASE